MAMLSIVSQQEVQAILLRVIRISINNLVQSECWCFFRISRNKTIFFKWFFCGGMFLPTSAALSANYALLLGREARQGLALRGAWRISALMVARNWLFPSHAFVEHRPSSSDM
ncbi:hypothetical protein [Bacterioplanes sanyensis]|uniref:hypothetical protein n=1 Tax=Bacterioplanes sanyensis TaxID=1249553 RepID=UPI00167640B7|nr:hypothetical protein [Bacterioplanes sanyensis]